MEFCKLGRCILHSVLESCPSKLRPVRCAVSIGPSMPFFASSGILLLIYLGSYIALSLYTLACTPTDCSLLICRFNAAGSAAFGSVTLAKITVVVSISPVEASIGAWLSSYSLTSSQSVVPLRWGRRASGYYGISFFLPESPPLPEVPRVACWLIHTQCVW